MGVLNMCKMKISEKWSSRRSGYFRMICCLFCLLGPLWSMAQVRIDMPDKSVDVDRWITARFAKGKVPPFSFDYGGVASDRVIRSWRYGVENVESGDSSVVERIYTYRSPDGLEVSCRVKGFKEYGTVEWLLRFKNTSAQNSATLSQVKTVDAKFCYSKGGPFKLHYAEGNHISKSDYHPRTRVFQSGDSLTIKPVGGRSSEGNFPFFNIESPAEQGIMVGIGWTGTWFARLDNRNENSMLFEAGMENLETYLYPGEEIRTPSICLMFWQGADRMTGHNQFRRFVLAHHSRKIDGKFAEYPLCSGFNYRDPAPCTEYSCITADWAVALIHRYAQFGLIPDVFWLDAGWHTGASDYLNGKSWANTTGNWTVDTTRFPEGLKPVADAAHRVGAKFMVWFEPERVIKGTQWAIEHPEWMLELSSDPDTDYLLFDLGNPEACKWLCQYIGDMIEENGIDYYRQDCNIQPDRYWREYDEPGRSGIKEIRHVEGLYAFWDYLLERFPNMLIDNCASGGKRIDLETIGRSAPLWRSDYYHYDDPDGYQCHTYGLNFFLPVHGTGILQTNPYSFRSSLSSTLIYNWKITDPDESILDMQEMIHEYRDIQPYYYGDYYPLTGIGDQTSDSVWLAYQLHLPGKDQGIIVAFRRQHCEQKSLTVCCGGLDAAADYEVFNVDTGIRETYNGAAMAKGLVLKAEQPRGSVLLKYKRVGH